MSLRVTGKQWVLGGETRWASEYMSSQIRQLDSLNRS